MKKLLLLLAAVTGSFSVATAQCTITPGCSTGSTGYCTTPAQNASLPNATENTPYSTTVQLSLGSSIGGFITVTDATVTAVTGLPTGLSYSVNPSNGVIAANSDGCVLIAGTPAAGSAGNYTLTALVIANTSAGPFPVTATWMLTVDAALTTGIKTISQAQATIVMAPNPVKSELNLMTDFNFNKVQVIDALGNVVMTQEVNGVNQTSLNLQQLNAGVYFVQINDGSRVLTRKLIKE
jgi:hypothetical protein